MSDLQGPDETWEPPTSPSDVPTPAPQESPSPTRAPGAAPEHDPFALTIGDIGITRDQRVVTPNGVGPLAGSTWIVQDMSQTQEKTPTWAVFLAIVGIIACLLGLFFLLVKERTTTGYVQVQVQSDKLFHMTQIPVRSPMQVNQTVQLVRQAQTMAAAATAG